MTETKVISFTFTPAQLRQLILDTIGLYEEYQDKYERDMEDAGQCAADDTIDGLGEAQWLIDNGELEPHSGQVYP